MLVHHREITHVLWCLKYSGNMQNYSFGVYVVMGSKITMMFCCTCSCCVICVVQLARSINAVGVSRMCVREKLA